MIIKLENGQDTVVPNATVKFLKGTVESITAYYFDTSNGGHPMVNAMAGLALLKDGDKLIMINHCAPMGLFPKVENEFDFVYEDMPNGLTQIVFTKKIGSDCSTDFTSTSCSGGCG